MIGFLTESTVPIVRRGVLSALAHKYGVPGAQLAIHHDGETVALEVGELEYRTGRRVTRDSAIPVGSISKSFTATVAMILAEDGDLELDAPVGDYSPELDDLGAHLTLRQLLSHTSGLPSGPDLDETSTVTLRRHVMDHCRHENLVLRPGTGFSYSNLGYVLVGHLIETVTGMSWSEATESILLRPLGIQPAFITGPGLSRPGRPLAAGHSVNAVVGRTRPVRQALAAVEAPAGGLALSATDLVSLGLLHIGSGVPGVLPAGYADQMRRPVPAADPFGLADGWGLGLAVFRQGTADWVGHDGNADGTSCHLRIDPAGGWVIAFTSNANTGCGMWRELQDELVRAGVPIGPTIGPTHAPISCAPSTAPLCRCVGSYVNSDVECVVAAGDGGRLYLSIDDDDFALITVREGLTFFVRDPGTGELVLGGRFVQDPRTGKVDAIQIGGRLARRCGDATRDTGQRLAA